MMYYAIKNQKGLTFHNELYRHRRSSLPELRVRRAGVAPGIVGRYRVKHEASALRHLQPPRRHVVRRRQGVGHVERLAVLLPAYGGDRRVGVCRTVEARRHSTGEEPAPWLAEHLRKVCNNNGELDGDDRQ